MTVRAKLTVTAIKETMYGSAKTLTFSAQYDTSIPEDQRFQKATPCCSFDMTVDNPAALEQLKLGQAYYVDFNPVPKAE